MKGKSHKTKGMNILKRVMSAMLVAVMLFTMVGVYIPAETFKAEEIDVTIRFKNSNNWSTVNAYIWDESNTQINGGWPGYALEKNGDDYVWYGEWDNEKKLNVIFSNNGSSQTADLSLTPSELKNSSDWRFSPDGSKESLIEILPVYKDIKVRFQNTQNWENVYAYVWDANGNKLNGNWPGNAVTVENGYYVWTKEAWDINNPVYLIFNNGSEQTVDLPLTKADFLESVDWIFMPTSQNGNWECSRVDGSIPEYDSPVINGNKVTFNYFSKTASDVKLAGSMTGWQNNPVQMTEENDGNLFSVTLDLTPDSYEYKFIVDGGWTGDPKNLTDGDKEKNSNFVITGFQDAKGEVKKGTAYQLPSTLDYVQSSGTIAEDNNVSYALKETYAEGIVTLKDGTITVDPAYNESSIVLAVSATVGGQAVTGDYTLNLVDKMFTYTIYAHSAVDARNKADAMGLWIWDAANQSTLENQELVFEEVPLNGQTWLKTSKETTAYIKLGLILKSKGAWNWQTDDIFYANNAQVENVDIYLVDGYPTAYTSLDKVPEDHYVYVEYTREDGNYENANVYTWNTGYVEYEGEGDAKTEVNYSYNFEKVNGEYIAKIPVVVGDSDRTIGFIVRKGDAWDQKDGGDNFATIPADQDYVKLRYKNGAISYVLPDYVGSEINRKKNIVTFYYRDEAYFLKNNLNALGNVELVLRTKSGDASIGEEVSYVMEYDDENERYSYSLTLQEDTDYYYYYKVNGNKVLDSTSTRTETIDNVEYSLRRNKSYKVNVLLDVTNNEMETNNNNKMDYEDNAVLSVSWEPQTANDTIEGFYVEEIYADFSELGLGNKVEIDPNIKELTFGCLDSVPAGEKTITVTVIDDCGLSYTGTAVVEVTERTKTANTESKLGDFDWDEAVIYFAVTDRFFDGNSNNNAIDNGYDTNSGASYHGGDFTGLTKKIDYLYDLGVNTIWITPIVDNIEDGVPVQDSTVQSYGYHGYWASDFTQLNPHLGSEEELEALIEAAHAKGMKIMVDVVLNHAGYGTESYFNKIIPVEGASNADGSAVYKDMIRDDSNRVPGDDRLDSLSGLPDFVTEDEEVRAQLIEWQTTWMTKFGIDYYRVDTVKHVDNTTWTEFKNELTKINSEFKLIGEYYDGGFYNDFDQLDSGKMDSILDFHFNDVISNIAGENLAAIEDALNYRNALLSNTGTMGSFLSSHDENGFLHDLRFKYYETEEYAKKLMKVAATYQITAKGQPVIYYGEEIGLTGQNIYPDQPNRYDFNWTEQANQASDTKSMYNHYKTMLNIRRDYSEVFAKGERYSVVYPEVKEKVKEGDKEYLRYVPQGYSVFARSYEGTTLYVGTNVWGDDKEVTFFVEGKAGSVYKDLYSDKTYTVAADGSITVTIPGLNNGNGTMVLVRISGEKVEVKDTNTITLKLHYARKNDDYDNGTPADTSDDWNAWVWGEGIKTEGFKFVEENGEMVATITINNARMASSASFRMRKGDWKENDHGGWNQSIDLSDVVSGTVHYYVNEGVWGGTTVLGSDAVVGTKITNAKYDRGTNSAIITMNRPITGNLMTAFEFTCVSGEDKVIQIANVTEEGNVYTVSFKDDITDMLEVIKSYTVKYDDYTYTLTMPNIYTTEEFENAYTYDGEDLGLTFDKDAGEFTFKVWAPTAENVTLNVYESGTKGDNTGKESFVMTKAEKGVWKYTLNDTYANCYYTYTVNVLDEDREVCDPYARTTGVNGNRAMILDLDTTDPEGWEDDEDLNLHEGMEYTDAIIYELHVRDLSIADSSGVDDDYQGKFLGLTQTGTETETGVPTALDHIIDLGVTHLHLLPVYDYASVDEANLDKPQFNWGYDPLNYNVPEGSYSTDPYNGEVRVKEMKEMIMALHENNINVVMDVVYNHVYDAGSFSVNQIVPNYFSRTNPDGSFSDGSGCGNDTATERDMVHKFVVDSILYWHDEYHIDGFRFDLVGLLDAITINKIVESVHAIDPSIIFYGEGWTMGTALSEGKENYIMATQANAWATDNFAYFSDTLRDNLAGKDTNKNGFIWENGHEQTIEACFFGNPGWCADPLQTINYASCHDNYTLMDKINIGTGVDYSKGYDYEPGVYQAKLNNLTAAVYMLSEGIPLIHAGEDFLRIKLDEQNNVIHNSYNSSDYVNMLRWENLDEEIYKDTYEYYKGLIEFRKNHKALRLDTEGEVDAVVTKHWYNNNLIAFKLDGSEAEGEVADEIIVIFNATGADEYVDIRNGVNATDGIWNVCIDVDNAGKEVLYTVDVKDGYSWPKVAANSALVLVKGETEDIDSVYTNNNNVTVTLDNTALALQLGGTKTLTATVNPANSTLIWTSSDENVVTVNDNGNVTATGIGEATITVSTLHGVTATCTVTVGEKQSVTLNETSIELKEGATTTLTAEATPSDTTVSWHSENEEVATVENGVVTAVAQGTTVIYVETPDGAKAECTVTVLAKESVSLDKTEISLKEGMSERLMVNTSVNAELTWTSSDDTIASVDQTGNVTAHKKGIATITVTTQDEVSATCVVTVTEKDSITLNQTTLTLKDELTATLIATTSPSNTTVTWTSSNSDVATVDQSGKVIAVAIGETTITATTTEGETATCVVTVEGTISLDETSINMKEGEDTTLTVTITPSNTLVSWSSDNTDVAAVDGTGKVTANKAGTATITASINDETYATCVVTVTHDMEEVKAKAETCTEEGYEAHYKCKVCGDLFKDAEGKTVTTLEQVTIPKIAHTLGLVDAKAATCTEDGHNAYYKCELCFGCFKDANGKIGTMVEAEKIPATGHKNLIKVDEKAATCTTDGNKAYYKCNCGKLFEDAEGTKETTLEEITIGSIDHEGQAVDGKAATCTEDGHEAHFVCENCKGLFLDKDCTNATTDKEVVIAAKGHKGKAVAGKVATCTEAGTKAHYVCENCKGLFEDENCNISTTDKALVLAAKGHIISVVEAKEPTLEEYGNIKHYACSNCNDLFLDEAGTQTTIWEDVRIDKLQPEGDPVVLDKTTLTLTEKSVGSIVVVTSPDGSAVTWTTSNEAVATVDEDGNVTAVSAGIAIIEATAPNGRFATCRVTVKHDLVLVEAKEADCSTEGNLAHYKCEACGKLYEDEAGEIETTLEKVTIETKAHNGKVVAGTAATCTEAGKKVHYVCENCEGLFLDADCKTEINEKALVIAPLGHDMTEVEGKDATCTEAGNKAYYECETCDKLFLDEAGTQGTTLADVTLAAKGHAMTKVEAKEATCTVAGNKAYYECGTCDKLFLDEAGTQGTTLADVTIAAKGHAITKVEAKEPTTTSTGNKEYYVCDGCGQLFLDEEGTQKTTLEEVTLEKLQPEDPKPEDPKPEEPKEDVIYVPENKIDEQVSGEADKLIEKLENEESLEDVVSEETLEKVQDAIANNEQIITELVVENLKEVEVEEIDKELVEEAIKDLKENSTSVIAQYLDIRVVLKNKRTKEELGTLNKLSEEVILTFEIPTEWKKEGRIFSVIRVHEGKADVLKVWENGDGTISFKTGCFSTYALIYTDPDEDKENEPIPTPPGTPETPETPEVPETPEAPEAPEVPETPPTGSTPPESGDNSQPGVYVLVLLAGLAAAMAGVVNSKRKQVK